MLSLEKISQLSVLYTQPHRYYHNLNHINLCLWLLEKLTIDVQLPKDIKQSIELSIWFHDAIYNPYSLENEKNSAELLRSSINTDHTNQIYDAYHAILATASHTKDQNLNKDDIVTMYMLDIDLAGLADDESSYKKSSDNIRKEYSFLSDEEFYKNRIKFLRNMLQRSKIYYTKYFQSYENNARINMQNEINYIQNNWNIV